MFHLHGAHKAISIRIRKSLKLTTVTTNKSDSGTIDYTRESVVERT